MIVLRLSMVFGLNGINIRIWRWWAVRISSHLLLSLGGIESSIYWLDWMKNLTPYGCRFWERKNHPLLMMFFYIDRGEETCRHAMLNEHPLDVSAPIASKIRKQGNTIIIIQQCSWKILLWTLQTDRAYKGQVFQATCKREGS